MNNEPATIPAFTYSLYIENTLFDENQKDVFDKSSGQKVGELIYQGEFIRATTTTGGVYDGLRKNILLALDFIRNYKPKPTKKFSSGNGQAVMLELL